MSRDVSWQLLSRKFFICYITWRKKTPVLSISDFMCMVQSKRIKICVTYTVLLIIYSIFPCSVDCQSCESDLKDYSLEIWFWCWCKMFYVSFKPISPILLSSTDEIDIVGYNSDSDERGLGSDLSNSDGGQSVTLTRNLLPLHLWQDLFQLLKST